MKTLCWAIFILLLNFPQNILYSQFNGSPRKEINKNQPISQQEVIYRIINDGVTFVNPGNVYFVEETSYVYEGLINDKVKILYKYEYTDESISPAKKTKFRDLTLPLNSQKQALLNTEDNKKLLITVIDDSNRITVEEVKEH